MSGSAVHRLGLGQACAWLLLVSLSDGVFKHVFIVSLLCLFLTMPLS